MPNGSVALLLRTSTMAIALPEMLSLDRCDTEC